MMLSRIDSWIGRTLFVPPIIKLCQVTRQSQFAIARLFWFMAALDGFYRAETLVSSILFGLLSLVMMLTASLRADRPTQSSVGFRLLAVALFLVDLVTGLVIGDWRGIEFWIFVMIAEYAGSIRTIPPRETRKTAAKMAGTGA